MSPFWKRKTRPSEAPPEPIQAPALPAPILYPWGGLEFEEEELAPHFAVMGMTDSGKTLSIRMLMKAALVEGGKRLRHRALVPGGRGTQDFSQLTNEFLARLSGAWKEPPGALEANG